MKKSVYRNQTFGSGQSIDLEILLDINRDLTENDKRSISCISENLFKLLAEESMNIDPEIRINALKEKEEILSIFGQRVIFAEEIPNGYSSGYYHKFFPWFIVTTNKGRIKIGWRKRVIEIDWSDSVIEYESEFLFHSEDVTKDKKLIHAWGIEKAKEYINLLLDS